MKGKKHKPEQIIGKLREADALLNRGASVGEVSQKLSISEQTFHRWRQQYGRMKAEGARRRSTSWERTKPGTSPSHGLLRERPRPV